MLGFLGSVIAGAIIVILPLLGVQKMQINDTLQNLGGNISPPKVNFANVPQNLVPSVNNTYDVGSPTKSWKDIYASGTITSSALSVTGSGTTTFTGGISAGQSNFTGNVTGISLSEIEDLTVNKTFNMANKILTWNFSNPTGGMMFNMTGAGIGHFVDITQQTGNPAIGSHLLHINSEDADVTPLHIVPGATTYDAAWFKGAVRFSNDTATTTIEADGDILPTNNLSDLGGWGKAWKDIYASSSVRVGNGAASTTISNSGNITLSGIIQSNSATATSTFAGGATVAGETLLATGAGNVGIGTTAPVSRLQIGDNTVNTSNQITLGKYEAASQSFLPVIQQKSVLVAGAGNDLALGAESSSGGILFYTGGVTSQGLLGSNNNDIRMAINPLGNVGIANTAPLEKLSVTGRIFASQGLLASGTLLVGTTLAENATSTFLGSTTSTNAGINNKIIFGNGMCIGEWSGTTTPNLTIQLCSGF